MKLTDTQRLQWLSNDELSRVHEGSCRLLAQVGVKVTHDRIAEILKDYGAEQKGDRILVPRELIDRALADTAKSIQFDAPDASHGFTVDASKNEVRFGTGGQALYVVHKTESGWEKKSAENEDLSRILALCDKLEHVDFVTRPVECDVPEDQMDVEKAKRFRDNSSKPMNLANLVKTEKLDEIVEIIGDKAYLSFIVCLVASPLTMDTSAGEKMLTLLEHDFPVAISSCPQGGSTAPFSEVGELVQLNAELLFGYVLANAVRPGAKVLYRGIPITSDLYSDGSPRWCQPESIRRVALAAQVCRYYGIPCCGTAGVSDEEVPSIQGISEKVLSWSYEAASGAHYINSALGMLHQVMSVAPYQYVIDNIALGILKEEFASHSDREIGETAVQTAKKVLSHFGAEADETVEAELRSRIEHIETGKEPYTDEYIDKQISDIEKAATRQGGSNVFMKGARKGLREGYLYSGSRLDASLDLAPAKKQLESLTPEGGILYE